MENTIQISVCDKKHYFLDALCPCCGEGGARKLEYREGDCIDCGQFCPGYAYCCTSPNPLGK